MIYPINTMNDNSIFNVVSNALGRPDSVEMNILAYFKEQGYKIGDSIPNEAQLAANLGIARGVLREALSPLKMIGLIESRTRRGMFLREPSFLAGLQLATDPHFMSEASLFNLLELRMAIEIGISANIFQKITSKDISELEQIVEISSVLDNNSYSPISEFTFHSKLYQITGNDFITDFQQIIHPIMNFVKNKFSEYIEPINIELKAKGEIVTHSDLLQLIKKKDYEAYKHGIEMHFQAYRLFIKEHDPRDESNASE